MKKIWEWSFREIFLYKKDPLLCIKKLKEKKIKSYFWVKIWFNQKIYSLLKYWKRNFNNYDYEVLKKVEKIIPNNIPKNNKITDKWLVQSIITNYDWEISQNILDYKWELSKDFFEKLEILIDYLIKNWIEPMDIFHNTIVQEYEKWKQKPILFDFKRIGWRTYIFQPWLMFSKELRRQKIYRRLDKLKIIFK